MFNVILLCLLTCCSSLMPLKQSESIIGEDNTQFFERKFKNNYYAEGRYDVKYSFSVFCSDIYWTNFQGYYDDNMVFLGSDNTISWYDLVNNGTHWLASSSLLDQFYIYRVYNNNMEQMNHNDFYFSSCEFYITHENTNAYYYILKFSIRCPNGNATVTYNAYFDNVQNYIGCTPVFNDIFQNTFGPRFLVSLPKGGCGISISGIGSSTDYDNGYNIGYNQGYNDGYDEGEERGKEIALDPASEIYDLIFSAGYQSGFQSGVDDTIASGNEAMIIFSGIMDVAFIPVNVFFLMFNYEVFGINIAGFVSGLLTIAIVLIIFKFILGRKI